MKRNKFGLSYYKLFSCDMGNLVPCGLMEVLPGDTVQLATSLLVRASPLLAPVMHPVQVRVHHWFVPNRLVWDEWEEFITGGPDGLNNSVHPTRDGAVAADGAEDYLGLPPGFAGTRSVLPLRAYQLIYNEWYRDQDLMTTASLSTASGDDNTTTGTLRNIAWEKDYFTSARPWEQKGPSITIPLGTRADVMGIGTRAAFTPDITSGNIFTTDGTVVAANTDGNRWHRAAGTDVVLRQGAGGSYPTTHPDVWADLSGASAISINILREAFALQRYEENRARFGSRYVEYLRSLGVRSSDARLQRPEYLGGGRQTIQFSEVLQTAPDDADNPVGQLKGHGISALRSNRFRKFFEEHGFILSLFSVRPKTMYMNGMSRTWNRRTKEDYFQKELQHIGQQEVLNKEVYSAHTSPDGVFGYQDRYDEYRRMWSDVGGEFRTTDLDYWHMARSFAADPALNNSFIACVPTERTFAVPSKHVLWVMARHSVQARRIVAKTGTSFIM